MSHISDLSARELEILQLVLACKTNKAIANELCIREKTVEFHLDNLYTKLGARTRLMAGSDGFVLVFEAVANSTGS